jgi:MazG family protein
MKKLRRECPWDRKQTADSLRQYLLEETYETIESIDERNWEELKKELGDLLLQIVFQAEIAEENKLFSMSDVIKHINEKLIRRHPHVFGEVKVRNAEEVKDNWEKIKIHQENRKSVLEGVPKKLCGLLRAQRLQEKAAQVGFDWENTEGIVTKIREEISEMEAAIKTGQMEEVEDEFGDLLFSLVNLARFLNLNAEDALRKTMNKFISRFQFIEKKLAERDKSVHQTSMEEMNELWEESKNENGK